jgi:hypothetical protein
MLTINDIAGKKILQDFRQVVDYLPIKSQGIDIFLY